MRRRTERLIVALCIVLLGAAVGRLDERFVGQQDRTYVSLVTIWDEWRSNP